MLLTRSVFRLFLAQYVSPTAQQRLPFSSRPLKLHGRASPDRDSNLSSLNRDEKKCPICQVELASQKHVNYHLGREHYPQLTEYIRENPRHFYLEIFGEGFKRISAKEIRYTEGLVVTLEGQHKGLWYSFLKGKGGGPLEAIRDSYDDLDYPGSILRAFEILALSPQDFSKLEQDGLKQDIPECRRVVQSEQDSLVEARILSAQSIWENSRTNLKNSLAELYLKKHRKIPRRFDLNRLSFRYLPEGSTYSENGTLRTSFNPALIVPVENDRGKITGVQRVFLDRDTGGKPKGVVSHKFSKGVVAGSGGIVQRGRSAPGGGNTVYLVEGPETGATLAATVATEKDTVIASLSIGNLDSLGNVIRSYKPSRLVLGADNDDGNENAEDTLRKSFEKLKSELPGVKCRLVKPELQGLEGKCDWNDMLKLSGPEDVIRQFDLLQTVDKKNI